MLTFGGRPRFLWPAGADEPSAADDDVAFLFLLPLGRPRPRLTGVVGEGSRREKGLIRLTSRNDSNEK